MGKGPPLFERYTERARRSIFFARYEASVLGTLEITSGELLLGVLREDKTVSAHLASGAGEAIRKELEQLASPKGQRVATSVDMPLSDESKRALAYAAEEAENLNHKHIDPRHLVLGLMRVEESLAAKLLQNYGMVYEQYRKVVGQTPPESDAVGPAVLRARHFGQPQPAQVTFVALPETVLAPAIHALRSLVNATAARLRGYANPYGDQRFGSKPWTPKEALGHLIDWAIAHHQWVAQAVMDSKVEATGYPDRAEVAVQHYADFPWPELVDLWLSLNRLLIHVLARIPEEKLQLPCRIGVAEPVPLAKLVEAYVEHCQDLVEQMRQE